MANFLGKALTGAAQVAVPAAMETHRANIQAKRDKVLQGYAEKNEASRQKFMGKQRQLDRDLTTSEGAANRALTAQGQENMLEWQGMQYMANEAARKDRLALLERQLEKADLEVEALNISLADAKDMRRAYEAIMDPGVDSETRQIMAEYINLKNPETRRKVIVKQLQNDIGAYTDDFAIFDASTGQRLDGAAPGGDIATINTQAEYDALPPGAVYIDAEDGKTYQKPGG